MLAMRTYQRGKHVDGVLNQTVLEQVGLTADANFVASDGSEYATYRDFYRTAPASLR